MTVQIDFWELLIGLAGLASTYMFVIFGFAKVLGKQLEKRLDDKFEAQDTAREIGASALRETIDRYTDQSTRNTEQIQAIERDFLNWKAEMPVLYVRREDYIRGQSVIEAKLDALYNKLEVVQLKGAGHG
jgi:hypothetical protein